MLNLSLKCLRSASECETEKKRVLSFFLVYSSDVLMIETEMTLCEMNEPLVNCGISSFLLRHASPNNL